MTTGFCEACGSVLLIRRNPHSKQTEIYCPKCQTILDSNDAHAESFVTGKRFDHRTREETIILDENNPPPLPVGMNATRLERIRCSHKNAVFQGSYQFGRGDEPSRNYWLCKDCGRVFRFGGRFKDLGSELPKKHKHLIHPKSAKADKKT
jgi:DNA-directed RNA polymerase subunit M/transcription elongation factor TFIIS